MSEEKPYQDEEENYINECDYCKYYRPFKLGNECMYEKLDDEPCRLLHQTLWDIGIVP